MESNSDSIFYNSFLIENVFFLKQKKELLELVGFETRNKYSIELENGAPIAYAAEDGKNLGAIIGRHFLGHWRSFKIVIFDINKNPLYYAEHPFRILFSRINLFRQNGELIGSIVQRFSIFQKSFDILDSSGKVVITTRAPIWKPWTFPMIKNQEEAALVLKRWSGLFKEALLDTDHFTISFRPNKTNLKERELILAATLLIDIVYFENKSSTPF